MVFGDIGEEKGEKGRKLSGEAVDDAAFPGNFHHAGPEGEHGGHGKAEREGVFGRLEDGVCHSLHILGCGAEKNTGKDHKSPEKIHKNLRKGDIVNIVYEKAGKEMKALTTFSSFMIPAVFFYITAVAMTKKTDVFGSFLRGAKKGLLMAVELLPTLTGLFLAVGILRASGLLDGFSAVMGKVLSEVFPAEVLPLAVVRLFSASAATGFLLDIFKEQGPDSYVGILASLLLSSTETLFYCMSIYFPAADVKKTRCTVWGALLATAAGMAASVWLAGRMGR